ncbi:hypothetical protein [Pseudoroseicyclus aestuarii]|uniref:HdeA/HdeB family protein n=1 Tax=Pseudoroseicyclus aestuarii TaxID=1795041 RepID=A0A318SUL1_9RHOB|nr:hypothetical protein [Pseudoroseicyclus aestuarii]PYE85590.1 hypothetical protein DFP88_101258 [Pseudoroseicyclus aestuarii]
MNALLKTAAAVSLTFGMAGAAFAQADDADIEMDPSDIGSEAVIMTCETFLDLDTPDQLAVVDELHVMSMQPETGEDAGENLNDTATGNADVNSVVDACSGNEPMRVSEVMSTMTGDMVQDSQ